MTTNDRQTRRALEHLTLLLQKSGHVLAAYLVQPQGEAGEVELLLLVPDEALEKLGEAIAAVVGAHLAVIPDTEPIRVSPPERSGAARPAPARLPRCAVQRFPGPGGLAARAGAF
jgi:hypothetical protein